MIQIIPSKYVAENEIIVIPKNPHHKWWKMTFPTLDERQAEHEKEVATFKTLIANQRITISELSAEVKHWREKADALEESVANNRPTLEVFKNLKDTVASLIKERDALREQMAEMQSRWSTKSASTESDYFKDHTLNVLSRRHDDIEEVAQLLRQRLSKQEQLLDESEKEKTALEHKMITLEKLVHRQNIRIVILNKQVCLLNEAIEDVIDDTILDEDDEDDEL